MTRIRIAIAVTASVVAALVVGALTVSADAATTGAKVAAPTVQSRTWALSGGQRDVDLVRAHAGQFMKKTARVHAVRGNAEAVRNLVFRSNEGPNGDARWANGRQLLVTRVDGADNVDLTALPTPPGFKLTAQQAVVTVTDPVSGALISVTTIPAGDSAAAARVDLARFGTVVPVDVQAGDLFSARVAKANAAR